MFGKKKTTLEDLLKDFDKYIVLATYKNEERAVVAVNGNMIDLSILFKSLFEDHKEVRDIAKASIHVIEMLEEAEKKSSNEKTEPKKAKKSNKG